MNDNDIEKKIKAWVEKRLKYTIHDVNQDLLDLGVLDSLSAIDMLTDLEREFCITIPFSEYTQPDFFSIQSITNALNKVLQQS